MNEHNDTTAKIANCDPNALLITGGGDDTGCFLYEGARGSGKGRKTGGEDELKGFAMGHI